MGVLILLPQAMQVKDLDRTNRFEWIQLAVEDTIDHQGIRGTKPVQSARFLSKQAAGMKSVFERPAAKKCQVDRFLHLRINDLLFFLLINHPNRYKAGVL